MELEQRVKTLEYEVKILKNEVQRTLLDIQEQVLVHYYPTLRSDDSIPPDGATQTLEGIRAKQVKPAEPPSVPAIKQVSLEEIRATQKELMPSLVMGPIPAPNPTVSGAVMMPQTAEQESVAKLLEWVVNSAAKVGDDRDNRKVNQVLDELQKLNDLFGRANNVEEALAMVKEAKIG